MVNFKLKGTAINRAVFLEKIPPFLGSKILREFLLSVSLVSFVLFLIDKKIAIDYDYLLETAVLSLVLSLFFWEVNLFFKKHLSSPRILVDIREGLNSRNIANFLDLPLARVMKKVEKSGNADSYLLLYYLLKDKELGFVFSRLLIDKKNALSDLKKIFKKRRNLKDDSFSPCLQKTIKDAFSIAANRGSERITKGDVFTSLCVNNNYLREVLYRTEVKQEDVADLFSWQERLLEKEDWFSNLNKKGSLGREWASGYTVLLDDYSFSWTKKAKAEGFPVTIGHSKEMESMERVLSRKEMNNLILVGEPGTGRKSMIRELARRSFLGETLPEIKYMRVVQLEIPSVLARAEGVEETEMMLDQIFKEAAWAGNVVLVIDEIHNFVTGEQRPGVVNISGILEPYLHLPSFHLIGITTFTGFRKQIEENPSISSLMEKVEIHSITEKETLLLLERITPFLERSYRKFISYVTLKKLIDLCKRYLSNDPFPEKAMSLLEEVVVHADQKKEYVVTPKHVAEVLSEKAEVPIGDIGRKEKVMLLKLEDLMHQRIVNQDTAVKEVSSALRRARAGVSTRKGLMGSFLFLGPTGVGKTETAKAIADIYFKTERRMIRIDMSEFQSISDISRLIGSTKEEGILTSRMKEDPFSLVLLDEIEKAHPDVLNIFLQILDEGHVTDGVGRKIDFKNSMVIATSNAGYQIIIDSLEKDWKEVKKKILDHLFRKGIFRPEFVNRFDAVVLFEPLSKDNLVIISGMQLKKIAKDLKDKEMEFIITEDLKRLIVEISYDPLFGAREMQRTIQDKIGNLLSSAILKDEIKKGDRFSINTEDFSINKH